jgi:hypothetical protein
MAKIAVAGNSTAQMRRAGEMVLQLKFYRCFSKNGYSVLSAIVSILLNFADIVLRIWKVSDSNLD